MGDRDGPRRLGDAALLGDFGSERELLTEYALTPGQIRLALAYRDEFPEEIDGQQALGRRSADELRSRYPFMQTFEASSASAGR